MAAPLPPPPPLPAGLSPGASLVVVLVTFKMVSYLLHFYPSLLHGPPSRRRLIKRQGRPSKAVSSTPEPDDPQVDARYEVQYIAHRGEP